MSLRACHSCPLRSPPPYHGVMTCTVDGRNVRFHAAATYCPHPNGPRFGDGTKPTAWDDVPVVQVGELPPQPPPPKPGPGDVVKSVLTEMGYAGAANCGCAAMQARMNELGWSGCVLHLPEIVTWFQAKAREQNIDVSPLLIGKLLRTAWKVHRDKLASAE